MKRKTKAAPAALVTYMLTLKDGTLQKVTVPAAWKVTFGPIAPGSKGYEHNGQSGLCLRLWESANQQRAVFANVVSFRDMSIAIQERVNRTKSQRMTKQTPNGAKDFIVQANISEWQNPDDPQSPDADFLTLPKTVLNEDMEF